MSVKIIIQRKIKPGKENEFGNALRHLRSEAIHAPGYISGEVLRSIEEPSSQLVISTWRSLEDWNLWAKSPYRRAFQKRTDPMLERPANITPYEYESVLPAVDDILSALESSIQEE